MNDDRYEYFTGRLGPYEIGLRRCKGWVFEWECVPNRYTNLEEDRSRVQTKD